MPCGIAKLPDEVSVSHTKRVGENKTVLQLKQFTKVLLIGLFITLKKPICIAHFSLGKLYSNL